MVLLHAALAAHASPLFPLQAADVTEHQGSWTGGSLALASRDGARGGAQAAVEIAGWGRYGLVERVEMMGRAAVRLDRSGAILGLGGGPAVQLIGRSLEPGPALSVGLVVGTPTLRLDPIQLAVPLRIGHRFGSGTALYARPWAGLDAWSSGAGWTAGAAAGVAWAVAEAVSVLSELEGAHSRLDDRGATRLAAVIGLDVRLL